MTFLNERNKKLLDRAMKAMENAHVLWGLKVGAAVLAEDGRMYEGCNVESWVSGLGTCAERCAVDHAVLHGNRKIKEVAVVMDSENPATPRPCGACLQYIYDFSENGRLRILMAKAKERKILVETVETKSLRELLPFHYHKR